VDDAARASGIVDLHGTIEVDGRVVSDLRAPGRRSVAP
jgi:hypothetical protein